MRKTNMAGACRLDRRRLLALAFAGAVSASSAGWVGAGAARRQADAPPPALEADLDALLDGAASAFGTVGHSAALLRRDRLVYERHAGLADAEAGTPVSPASVYPIFSVSKLFLIVALFQAAGRGVVDLDSPISAIRDDLPRAWRTVTLRQALSHVSGLPDYLTDLNALPPTAEAAIASIRDKPLDFPPGTGSRYNQTNYLLAKEAIERATGRPLTAVAAEQCSRAGMRRTHYRTSADPVAGLVHSYRPTPDRSAPPAAYPIPVWPDYTFGSSGAVTTLGDMIRWTRSLLGGALLPLPALLQSWEPQRLVSGAVARHANGWEYERHGDVTIVGHAGGDRVIWRHFFRTADPADNATVIYLDNGGRTFLNLHRLASLVADRAMPGAARPAAAFEERLFRLLADGRWEEAVAWIGNGGAEGLDDRGMEAAVNRVGYDALFALTPQAALLPFRFNVDRFPGSANVHDSLGEAYRAAGDLQAARASYSRALALDPRSSTIRTILSEIDAQIAAQ
ncbi:serine hydrolase [Sphingosinicella sp. CPCC 101087]|uniref:serine hydrolase n=1 Tax=Sphingosinicella sp. CPCC 101087 TaxID=2497754 RepID=UPI00101BB4C8|nr:serine hydrolase [Sphingosinicella sp. CPCC 101087]